MYIALYTLYVYMLYMLKYNTSHLIMWLTSVNCLFPFRKKNQ